MGWLEYFQTKADADSGNLLAMDTDKMVAEFTK